MKTTSHPYETLHTYHKNPKEPIEVCSQCEEIQEKQEAYIESEIDNVIEKQHHTHAPRK